MRLDCDLRFKILEKVGIYSARFGIQEPKVVLTTREVLELPKEITQGRRTSAYKYLGVSYMMHNLVFINVKKIPDEKMLENTIVHELIHLRFQYLSHGKRFNKLVRQGLAGKIFKAYRKRCKKPS
jgi:hypothetical protein